jgi:hypothetical protein
MTVICQLHEAGRLLFVSYMWQVIGVCQLHEEGRLLSVNYMWQIIGLSDNSQPASCN